MPLLLDLPHELLLEIWDTLDPKSDEGARNALVQTCHYVYDNFNSRLYRGTVQATAPHVCALEWAAKHGQLRTIHKLLNAGVDPVNNGSMALVQAANSGHRDVMQTLLWHDFDPNEKDNCGFCRPIHRAAAHGYVEIVKDLIEAGADIDSLSHTDLSAFATAVVEGHANVVSFFLERGVSTDVLIHGHGTSLAWAAQCGKEEVMKRLLDAGANIEAITDGGETVLHWAARGGHPSTVALLLDKGAAPDISDRRGKTPLHSACSARCPNEEIVTLLLEQNVEVNRRGLHDNTTPLATAASLGFVNAIKPLLERGADPAMTDWDGCTPLALAARFGHASTALALLEVDADIHKEYIDIPDECGRTPLFLATLYGHEQIVRILLARGSSARKKPTCAGRSPLSFADDHQTGKKNLRSVWEWLACPYYADIDPHAVQKASDKARRSFVDANCDQCQFSLSVYDTHFHCAICHNDDFDICMECIGGGYTCLDPSHVLQKFTSVDDNWVPVLDDVVHQTTMSVTIR
jgi:ankyrin repeat protein